MELFDLKGTKVKGVKLVPFKLEKEIQELVEKNTETFFNLEFVQSELTVGKYRIDTLCYDKENNSLTIIEYKKGKSYSVIDQGYTYLQLLLNNKADFVVALSQHLNQVLSKKDIDWSQSKIIFISQSFNSYQKDSVNFKNIPFELWEIKRYSNKTVALNKHTASSNESVDSLTNTQSNSVIASVSKEVKVFGMEDHVSKSDDALKEAWDELVEKMDVFDNLEIVPKKLYIGVSVNNKSIGHFYWKKSFINIELGRGAIKTSGEKSKNFFDLDDPKKVASEYSWTWKDGTKGNVYRIKMDKNTDLDYLMFLLKQKYKNVIS